MNEIDRERVSELVIDEWIWVAFIILSALNIGGDELEKKYCYHQKVVENEMDLSKKIFTLTVFGSFLIYIYLAYRNCKKYNKLIDKLMLLLTSDDDTGESFREALNIIEKFRLEIKIKYRKFLEKKVLKQMALQLKQLQKEAENRFLELQNYYSENMENSKSGKSR